MNKTYELIGMAKKNLNIESDYGIAKKLGFTTQNLSDWKNKPTEASGVNLLKIIVAAGISAEEALNLMTEQPMRKTGFATTEIMIAISGLSLVAVTGIVYSPSLASMLTAVGCILC